MVNQGVYKVSYYTVLLNAVECSVHLHGPFRLPPVNYFSIMAVTKHTMTPFKESGFFASDSGLSSSLSYHSVSILVTYQPQRTRLLIDVNVFGRLFLC